MFISIVKKNIYPILEELKDSAIVYLNYVIKQKLFSLEISDIWFVKIANMIFGCLKEEKIIVKHKQNLKNGLMTLLSKDLST